MIGDPNETVTVLHALSGAPAMAAAAFVGAALCLLVGIAWLCQLVAREALFASYVAPRLAGLAERVRRTRLVGWIVRRVSPRAVVFLRARVSPAVILGLHLSIGLVVSASALALFAVIADHVLDHSALVQFDLRLAATIRATASSGGLAMFAAITRAGSVVTLAGVALFVGLVLVIRSEPLHAAIWLGALAGGALLNVALKHLFHRPRPAGASLFITEMSFSFPSGHAMASLIAYGMLGYLLLVHSRDLRVRAAILAATVSLVALIGFSRLYLGVHYFTDVIGGYAAGAVWLSICIVTAQAMRVRAAGTHRAVSFTTGGVPLYPNRRDPEPTRGLTVRPRRWWVVMLVLGGVPHGRALAQDPVRAVDSTRVLAIPSTLDPLLDTLVPASLRIAIRHANPDLAARRALLDAAVARARATGHLPASMLTAEIEEVPSGLDVPHAASIKANVERELFAGARLGAARDLAAAEVRVATVGVLFTERRLVATAAQSLASATGALAIARRLAAEDSLLATAEVSTRARFSVGLAKYVDVLRVRTERLRVESERLTALTQARLGRRALIALVTPGARLGVLPPRIDTLPGWTPEAAIQLVDSVLAVRALSIGRLVLPPPPNTDSLLVSTGRLAAADAAYARAQRVRTLSLAELRPRVSALVGAQRFVGDNGAFVYGPTLGATVSLPFTARSAGTTTRAAAERDLLVAAAGRNAILAGARAELLAAQERYEAARARVTAYDAALLRGARDEREAALGSFRAGDLSLLELLDFERALARAEIDRIRGVIDATGALADLLGAGSPVGSISAGPATGGTGGT